MALLSACGSSGAIRIPIATKVELPPIPADIKECFTNVTDFPVGIEDLQSRDSIKLLIETRGSEIEKTLCGRRFIAWYEGIRDVR